MSNLKKFGIAFFGVGAIIALAAFFASRREKDYGFIVSECGAIHQSRLPVPLYVDKDLQIDYTGLVVESANWWSSILERPAFTFAGRYDPIETPRISNAIVVRGIESDDHGPFLWEANSKCELTNGEIQLPLGAPTSVFRNIVRHELGHALGLAHDDSKTSIMYPTTAMFRDASVSARDRELILSNLEDHNAEVQDH